MIKIIDKIKQYGYYYLTGQDYIIYSKKLHVLYQLPITPGKKQLFSLVSLKKKMKQVKAKYFEL